MTSDNVVTSFVLLCGSYYPLGKGLGPILSPSFYHALKFMWPKWPINKVEPLVLSTYINFLIVQDNIKK